MLLIHLYPNSVKHGMRSDPHQLPLDFSSELVFKSQGKCQYYVLSIDIKNVCTRHFVCPSNLASGGNVLSQSAGNLKSLSWEKLAQARLLSSSVNENRDEFKEAWFGRIMRLLNGENGMHNARSMVQSQRLNHIVSINETGIYLTCHHPFISLTC